MMKNVQSYLLRGKEDGPKLLQKGVVGNWKEHFTPELNERFEMEVMAKLKGSGLELGFELWHIIIFCCAWALWKLSSVSNCHNLCHSSLVVKMKSLHLQSDISLRERSFNKLKVNFNYTLQILNQAEPLILMNAQCIFPNVDIFV